MSSDDRIFLTIIAMKSQPSNSLLRDIGEVPAAIGVGGRYVVFAVVFLGSISYVQSHFFGTDSRSRIRAIRPKRHLY